MINHIVNIGDVVISERKASYTCFGLGSCIGLFITDRQSSLSAAAHIFLPEEEKEISNPLKFYNVVNAINEILRQFKFKGNSLNTLRAKIVGGASVINVNTFMGTSNTNSVIKHLTNNKIFIAAMDVGGRYSRTAKFESETGLLTVRIPELSECKIF